MPEDMITFDYEHTATGSVLNQGITPVVDNVSPIPSRSE